ncbi:PREDICTED: bone morphogenetic protein 1-like, partial [Amphimedon queenslandica]|uniref:Metalloendopeptidase n=1 Tax=Amphimedon queenslandica TaxID=400682 RepID=A0AAN0JPT3_AMPQE
MNRLTLFVLLLAIIQVHCNPAASKRSWDGPGPLKDENKHDSQLMDATGKEEDKEEINLDLGDVDEDEDKEGNNKDDIKDNDDSGKDKDEKDNTDDEDDKDDNFKSDLEELADKISQAPANFSEEYGSSEDVIEGDIKMTPEQAALFKRGGWDELVNSEAWLRNHGKWSRTIPYTISGVATRERNALTSSIKMFHDLTCLRFTPKQSYNRDYIQFVSRGGCWSYLGKQPPGRYARPQLVSLASGCYLAVPAHEIMHALGRFHEQSRADRDTYVRIITGNIRSGYAGNFVRRTTSDSQSLPYDYLSLMHYGRTAFSRNGQPTIQPKPYSFITIGQRNRLSMYDVQHINIRYCPERALRLVGGRGSFEGRVEVFWNGQWGTVCDDSFGRNDGRVICKYMGFPDVVATYHRARFGQGTGPIVMDDLRCAGNEYSPFACPMRTIGTHNCHHSEDASVMCQKNVRLVGGSVTSSYAVGRLEVYAEGRWGTVCDDLFDINDAHVVCRQLGYRRASCVYPRARYGRGTLPILMDDVQCTGGEAQITHCPSTPIGEHN